MTGGMEQSRIRLVPLPLYLALLTALARGNRLAGGRAGERPAPACLTGGFMLAELGGRIRGCGTPGSRRCSFARRAVTEAFASAGRLARWRPDGSAPGARSDRCTVGFFVTVLIAGSVMSIERAALPKDTARLMAFAWPAEPQRLWSDGLTATCNAGRSPGHRNARADPHAGNGRRSQRRRHSALSVAYADALGTPQSVLLARMLPPS